MKAKHKHLAGCLLCLAVFSSVLYAGDGERGYIGVMLDAQPLSPLLVKHLRLLPDQGLRINNINRGTPADRAGLERDDLIIALDGEAVTDHQQFVDNIIEVGAGNSIELEIIHEGKRKTLELTLAKRTDGFDPKFPPEPDIVQEWRPGKMFHFDVNRDGWVEIDGMDINIPNPKIVKPDIQPFHQQDIKRFFQEHYVFHYADSDPPCVVTIDGDPHDADTTLTVEQGDKKVSTTVDAMDALPEDVQDHAKRALKQARQSARQRTRTKAWNQHSQALEDFLIEHPPEELKDYTGKVLDRVKVFIDRQELPKALQSKDKLVEIEQHLKKLSARMERLERELTGKLRHLQGDEDEGALDDDQEQDDEAETPGEDEPMI